MIITGGFAIPAGFLRMPYSVLPSNGIATRSPEGDRCGSASLRHSTAFRCAACIWGMSCVNRNLPKW